MLGLNGIGQAQTFAQMGREGLRPNVAQQRLYNLLRFVPVRVAVWLHQRSGRPGGRKQMKAQPQEKNEHPLATA